MNGGTREPAYLRRRGPDAPALLLAAYRFFFLLPNFWLSDWPDRRGDAALGLRTPATMFSDHRMRVAVAMWSGGGLATAGIAVALELLPPLMLLDALGCVFPILLVRTRLPRTRRTYAVLDLITAWPLVTFGVAALR